MCIVLVTRTKKYYIILSNRDEFLARPTTRADWWPKPNDNVLSGRDLARSTHGTWLGITKQGRLTVLTNFRENSEAAANGATISRGEITKEFLLSDKPLDQWIEEVLSSGVYKDVGGFSLLCTILRKDAPKMAVISNRSTIEKGAHYVLGVENEVVGCQCEGLSNSLYHDEWPKVKLGKKLLAELTENDIENEEEFIEKGFKLLSYDLDLFQGANSERIRLRRRRRLIPFVFPFTFRNGQRLPFLRYLRIMTMFCRNGHLRIIPDGMERESRRSSWFLAKMEGSCTLSARYGMSMQSQSRKTKVNVDSNLR